MNWSCLKGGCRASGNRPARLLVLIMLRLPLRQNKICSRSFRSFLDVDIDPGSHREAFQKCGSLQASDARFCIRCVNSLDALPTKGDCRLPQPLIGIASPQLSPVLKVVANEVRLKLTLHTRAKPAPVLSCGRRGDPGVISPAVLLCGAVISLSTWLVYCTS